MKKLIFAVLMLASSAFATSVDKTPVIATLEGNQSGISQVAVLADGRLMLKLQNNKLLTSKLSEAALNEITISARVLANAEVKTTTRGIVCRMMVRPSLSNLSVAAYNTDKAEFEQPLRLVLTPQYCSLSTVVAPAEARDLSYANQLRDQILILALNQVKTLPN